MFPRKQIGRADFTTFEVFYGHQSGAFTTRHTIDARSSYAAAEIAFALYPDYEQRDLYVCSRTGGLTGAGSVFVYPNINRGHAPDVAATPLTDDSARKFQANQGPATEPNPEASDPCQQLGVSRPFTLADIKAALRVCAKKFHPDLHQNAAPEHQRQMSEWMKRIIMAFESLRKELGNTEP